MRSYYYTIETLTYSDRHDADVIEHRSFRHSRHDLTERGIRRIMLGDGLPPDSRIARVEVQEVAR